MHHKEKGPLTWAVESGILNPSHFGAKFKCHVYVTKKKFFPPLVSAGFYFTLSGLPYGA